MSVEYCSTYGEASLIASWRRFRGLNAGDRAIVLEAAAALMVAWAGLQIVPFSRLRRFLSRSRVAGHVGPRSGDASIDRIGWAVPAVARRLPAPMTCLTKALAADAMLRRRGFTSELRIGVSRCRAGSDPLQAHAWVECEGRIVVGHLDDLSDYVPLTNRVVPDAGCR